jgi:hypothetical protein
MPPSAPNVNNAKLDTTTIIIVRMRKLWINAPQSQPNNDRSESKILKRSEKYRVINGKHREEE